MRRTPSPALKFFLKWVCPLCLPLWIAGVGLLTCVAWVDVFVLTGVALPLAWSLAWQSLAVWLVGTGFLLWFRGRLKRVQVDADAIGDMKGIHILVGIATLLGVAGLIGLLWPVVVTVSVIVTPPR